MNILITHGYLLSGTGSNLYVSNLVREWCKAGHNVYLVCQDRQAWDMEFVSHLHEFSADNGSLSQKDQKDNELDGDCHVFVPHINDLLPVYVYDHYDGYTVKEFPDLDDQELKTYIDTNLAALNTILANFKIEVLQTNHTVMFPYIMAQVDNREQYKTYATVHGSALNFTVKKFDRFVPYALEGLEVCDDIIVDSKHAYDELIEFLEDEKRQELIDRVAIIPAGVDIDSFEMRSLPKDKMISNFQTSIGELADKSEGRSEPVKLDLNGDISAQIETLRASYDYRGVDQDVEAKVEALKEDGKMVLFVGKYLWTKGIHLILLSIPEILKAEPNTKFCVVGFGPFREVAELILECLAANRLDVLQQLVDANDPLFHGEDESLIPCIKEILDKHRASIEQNLSEISVDIKEQVFFTGIVAHKQLKHLLPCADVQIAASVFPEAFGMVAIEAMACGVYPVLTYQSAFAEITDELKEHLTGFDIEIQNVLLDGDASTNIAQNAKAYFELQDKMGADLPKFQNALREIVVAKYSWAGIAEKYIQVYN